MFRSGRAAQIRREALALLLVVLMAGQAVALAVDPHALDGGRALDMTALVWPGVLVVVLGIVFMAAAQLDLGASWRIGIDEGARPGLVSGGSIASAGTPFSSPCWSCSPASRSWCRRGLSLGAFFGTAIGIRAHVKDEEAYLMRTYGADYADYARRVGRFLPGVGRLA